jgi:prevent-host-death family protein
MAKQPPSSVGIKELKDQASAIVESVQRSRRPVVITKNNREVARIVPVSLPASAEGIRQRLADLGLLASFPRMSLKDLQLERVSLDASAAIAAIIEDRGED